MPLALRLPPLSERSANAPETRPSRVAAWLTETLTREPGFAARVIGEALAATNRTSIGHSRRLDITEQYWKSAALLWPRLERQFTRASHPLQGDNLEAATGALNEMVEQYDRLDERIAGIQALEKRGDEIDREVTRKLEDAFVTPFDREDIHELVSRLDDVVDGVQAIAETFVIYGVAAPTPEARRLAAILDGQGKELAQALRKLDGLKDLERHFDAVHELENEADGLSRAAVAKLFRDDLPPIDVIKWRDLYNYLEEAIDAAEDAAEAMERMYHKAN